MPAKLKARTAALSFKPQEIPMGMDPTQPIVALIQNSGQTGDRCSPNTSPPTTLARIPFDGSLIVPSSTDNYPPAFVGNPTTDPLGRFEGGNFGHCTPATSPPYAGHFGKHGTLIDDGVGGGSGGSGLSTLAATIRYGEFGKGTFGDKVMVAGRPASRDPPSHPVDLSVADLGQGLDGKGYVWPANKADGGFNQSGNNNYYSGPVVQLVNGALLVLPMDLDLGDLGLVEDAALQLAWTWQRYGARTANTQHGNTLAIATEWSTTGRVAPADGTLSGGFYDLYGFSMASGPNAQITHDMNKVIAVAAVVINDSASAIGGAGNPLEPLAPPLAA